MVQLRLPPLRERQDDIPVLAERLPRPPRRAHRLPPRRLSPRRWSCSSGYRWPGNVRELENALERALVLAEDEEIGPEALPDAVQRAVTPEPPPSHPDPGDLSVKRAQRALEAELIRRALERTQGNRTKAAELLELSPRALLYKISRIRTRIRTARGAARRTIQRRENSSGRSAAVAGLPGP